jgi:uncharacterized protein (UPF0332 family)
VSFDWESYLGLARTLAAQADEGARRSAVSRAYYAVFNKARLLLAREGVAVSTSGDSHAAVWNELFKQGKGRRRLGNDGKRLRDHRRKADYEDDVPSLDKIVEDALLMAEHLNRLIDAEAEPKPDEG